MTVDPTHAPPSVAEIVAEPPIIAPDPPRRPKWRAAVSLIRVPHWTKNAFVLAPLFFSQQLGDTTEIVHAVAAALVFCLISSAIYVVNDFADREEDARHPVKHVRPLASGELSGSDALRVEAVLLIAAVAVGLAAGLPLTYWAVVGSYVVINAAYSTVLRHVDLVDVCIIAAGFVLRILAGTTAVGVEASSWIVLSTGLLALLLALGKRRTDLAQEDATARRSLDGYTVEFIDTALATLAAAVIGFYSLFTVSDYAAQRFGNDDLYLTTFWVAVGILRYLQLVIAKGRYGSPTDIALRDRPIQSLVAGWVLTFYVLAYPLGS